MRERLDVALVRRGLFESREKAKTAIIAGDVRVGGNTARTPSQQVRENEEISVAAPPPYVSRGGFKLEKAIRAFGLDLNGLVCADIGASTGGFTDCMLQNGAKSVYAIDVGYGQLAWSLRNDPRVHVMERTNARNLESLPEKVRFVSIDVSFISLLLIFPAVLHILEEGGEICALIKPQFEAGKEHVGKKGVVRDPAVHRDVIRSVMDGAAALGLQATGIEYSPIRGPNGNIEYLLHLQRGSAPLEETDIERVVEAAHRELPLKAGA